MKKTVLLSAWILYGVLSYSQKGKEYFLIDTIAYDSLAVNDKELIDSLLPLYHRASQDTVKIGYLSELSSSLIDERIWSQYNRILHRKTKEKLRDEKSLSAKELKIMKKYFAVSLQNLGYYVQNYEGDQNKAMGYYAECLKIQKEVIDSGGIATTLNNMANTLSYQGNIALALEYYFESLKIREAMKDKEGMAGAYNNLATSYMVQKDSVKALEYLQKSIAILEELNHLYGLAYTFSNMGVIYRDRKDYEKAREYFQKSLDTWEKMKSDDGTPYALQNIGFLIQKQSELLPPSQKKDSLFALAIDYMNRGLKISERKNDFQGISSILSYLGNAYLSKNDLARALDHGLRSLAKGKEAGFPPLIRNAAELLYKIYRRQNKFQDALTMHELFIQMRDSIFNAETQKSTFKQQMKYDYEKQQVLKDAEHRQELALSEAEKKRQKVISYSVAVGLLLVAAFSVFIFNRLRITRKQKLIIEEQKQLVDHKNKHITASINYAKRIQDAILPSHGELAAVFPDHFLYFRPREIVSGDFYWLSNFHNGKTVLAVADCTGHGVPGAFMSMIGNTLLNEIVNEKHVFSPAEILNRLNEGIVQALHQESRSQDDGMDISICLFENNTVTFGGANHSLFLCQENSLKEIKGDFFSIGSMFGKKDFSFSEITVPLSANSCLYLFTDGFPDQLGGPDRKKFLVRQLQQLLLSVAALSLHDQKTRISEAFDLWKGKNSQLDDVLLMGIKI